MKFINPSASNFQTIQDFLRWAQSVYKASIGGFSFGQATGTNVAGVPNSFVNDNIDGVLIKIGGSGSAEVIRWVASITPLNINHGLQRQPIGFIIMDKDKTCDVYRTSTQDINNIALACTDATANVIVFIF